MRQKNSGFTLVELTAVLTIFAIVAISLLALFSSLVHSTIVAKRQAVASALATNQMEYLKSLPYDNLAVQGGSIVASSAIPATKTSVLNGVSYTITTSINYVDDQYDGCANYPSEALKTKYCRGYSSTTTSTVDTNPQDYKVAHVVVTDKSNVQLAEVDTEIAAKVSETASSTGALFVSVIDGTGSTVSGATIHVTNSVTGTPVDVSDNTDNNGVAIFYGLPPDSGTNYIITASKTNYSSLTTINASGSLQPTYPNQKILSQQPSYVTLVIKKQGVDSLIVEATDTTGSPLSGVRVYVKGGYKKYTDAANTAYYYDNVTPSDARPITDASGLAAVTNLTPADYVFCGDAGDTNCKIGTTSYYLVAAVPYGGSNSLSPITVPTSDTGAATYSYGGAEYLQKVRLILTTNSSFLRITSVNPYDLSLSTTSLTNFGFSINGSNLSCGTGSGCSSSVKLSQAGNDYAASCSGGSTQLSCTVDLTGITTGKLQLTVGTASGTVTLPTTPLGGFNVGP